MRERKISTDEFLRDRWRQIRAKQETPRVCLALFASGSAVAAADFDDRQDTTAAAGHGDSSRYRTTYPRHIRYIFMCTYINTCTRIRSTTREPSPLIYYRVHRNKKPTRMLRARRSNPLRLWCIPYNMYYVRSAAVADRR